MQGHRLATDRPEAVLREPGRLNHTEPIVSCLEVEFTVRNNSQLAPITACVSFITITMVTIGTTMIDSVIMIDIIDISINGYTAACHGYQVCRVYLKTATTRPRLGLSRQSWYTTTSSKKIEDWSLVLSVGCDVITPVGVVRNIGVLLDRVLSMKHLINQTRVCFQLRRLKQTFLSEDHNSSCLCVGFQVDSTIVTLCLSESTIAPQQRVQLITAIVLSSLFVPVSFSNRL